MTTKTILIADDVEINRILLQDFISEYFQTILASDGEEAISLLAQKARDIDMVLLDIRMPKKNGFDVLQFMQLHHLLEHIPVIVITGSDDYQDELRAYDFGASDIIHKPFVPQVVLRRIDNVLELFSHRKHLEEQLEESQKILADSQSYDPLTKLYTKQHFLKLANERLREAEKTGTCEEYGVIYCNIRNFKLYNLNYGMAAGDRVLKYLTSIVRKVGREDSLHTRIGSDHIVTLCRRTNPVELFQKVNDIFEEEYGSTGLKLKVGFYQIQTAGVDTSIYCDLAKIACDTIRDASENYCIYSEQIQKRMDTSAYVIQHLDEAIAHGYLQVYYQPVMRTLTKQLCGMEALARWIDPVMGFLSPADFIPVLENNHLISRLDLYMLRTICREMKEAEAKQLSLIPVSFNLSRLDFIDCADIFEEVEKIVREYGVPRDMLNIEITESIVTDNPDYMREIIGRFRKSGYQVWMDDFGSGYSSLNVLKDFRFDEIKLDMKFLASFDENSKKIIEAVITMAKRMGIQTLAEGVETQEQFDYLYEIGCEKVQGYLFSKPVPVDGLIEYASQPGIQVESRKLRRYYGDIGALNLITDRAVSIVEYDGKDFTYRYVNEPYREIWQAIGVSDMEIIYNATNSNSSALSRQLHDVHRILHKGDEPQEIVYSTAGQYIRLKIRCIAEIEERKAYEVEQTLLNTQDDEDKRKQLDNVFRMMYSIYDAIYLLDLQTGKFQTIMHGESNKVDAYKAFHDMMLIDAQNAAEVFIHPSEQTEYVRFADKDTMVDRLKATERGYITRYFRTLMANGAYLWKAHTLLYIPYNNSVIYCTRRTNFAQPGLIERVAPEYLADAFYRSTKGFHQILRRGVMESQNVNIFWKDKKRRFVGANEKFLRTYGFESVSQIVGKTDEDMGWHIDGEVFAEDEWRVLEKGELVVNRFGKCIIKGVVHNIMASKEPLYQEGKIVGLLGFFIDMDTLAENIGPSFVVGNTDQVTGLLSASGITNAVSDYAESWTSRRENFAVIRISLAEYYRAGQSFGEKIAREMMNRVGQVIAETFNIAGTCGRIYAGNFVVLMKCTDKEVVDQHVVKVRDWLENTHSLFGYPVTFQPKIEINYADETNDIHVLIGFAAGGSILDVAERKLLEEKLRSYDLQLQTVVDAIPGGVMLHEIQDDGSYKVVYASGGSGLLSGRNIREIKEDLNADNYNGMIEEDIPFVDNAVQETLRHGKPLNVSYRIVDKQGQIVWLNMKGRIIGEQNGHPLLLVIFHNLSEVTRSYEIALNETSVGVIVVDRYSNNPLYINPTADQIVQEGFDGSLHSMYKELIKANVPDPQRIMHEDFRFVASVRDKHYSVRLLHRDWNGRDSVMCYITVLPI